MRGKSFVLAFVIAGTVAATGLTAPKSVHATSVCSNQWQIQPSASPGNYQNNLLGVTALSLNDAWAVGYSSQTTTTGGQTTEAYTPLLEHWNGASWSLVPGATQGLPVSPTTVPGVMRAVWGSGPSDVWAVGDSGPSGTTSGLIEHWNGSTWSVVAAATNTGALYGVWGSGPSDVWAVGGTAATGSGSGVTEHWAGSTWQIVPGADSTVGSWKAVSGSAATDAWAFGDGGSGGTSATEHWDGTKWVAVSVPLPGNDGLVGAGGITDAGGGAVWLDGTGSPFNNGSQHYSYVAHSTTSGWQLVAVPERGRVDDLIAASSSASDDVWFVGAIRNGAGGNDPYANAPPTPDARHWNGQTMTEVPATASAAGGDQFAAVTTIPGQTWAVGESGLPGTNAQPVQQRFSLIEAICSAPTGGIIAEAPAPIWLPAVALVGIGAAVIRRRRPGARRP